MNELFFEIRQYWYGFESIKIIYIVWATASLRKTILRPKKNKMISKLIIRSSITSSICRRKISYRLLMMWKVKKISRLGLMILKDWILLRIKRHYYYPPDISLRQGSVVIWVQSRYTSFKIDLLLELSLSVSVINRQ